MAVLRNKYPADDLMLLSRKRLQIRLKNCVPKYVCMYVCCIYIHMYIIYIYVCVCIYIYIYIYISTSTRARAHTTSTPGDQQE